MRVRQNFLILAAVAAAIGLAGPAQADIPAGLDDFVKSKMTEYNVPGASVAIIDGDKVFTRGYGVRSVAKPGAVDADTLFMLASNTKPFTAALCAMMVDDKKMTWDDHVIDHLPEFVLKDSYATRNCTAVDLLAHRTGLPAFKGDNLEALGFDRKESLRRFRYMEPACTFREKANYSNPGLVTAGELAARLGGDTYENLIKKRIFAPLAMTRSGVSHTDYTRDNNVSDAHIPTGPAQSKVTPWDSSDTFGPAGEINSTANDMAHWMQMQLSNGMYDGRQIISKESIEMMHKPAIVEDPSFAEMPPINDHCGFSFSPGWGVFQYQGHEVLEKGGARAGARSIVVLVPDKHIGVAVMANQNLTVLPEAIRAWVLDKMVAPSPTDLQAAIADTNKQIVKMFMSQEPTKPSAPLTLPLTGYTGTYSNELYGPITILLEDGKLRWQAGPSKISGTVTPLGYNTFELAWPPGRISLPEEITFTLDEKGKPTQLATESFGLLKRSSP